MKYTLTWMVRRIKKNHTLAYRCSITVDWLCIVIWDGARVIKTIMTDCAHGTPSKHIMHVLHVASARRLRPCDAVPLAMQRYVEQSYNRAALERIQPNIITSNSVSSSFRTNAPELRPNFWLTMHHYWPLYMPVLRPCVLACTSELAQIVILNNNPRQLLPPCLCRDLSENQLRTLPFGVFDGLSLSTLWVAWSAKNICASVSIVV